LCANADVGGNSRFQAQLIDYITQNPEFIQPEARRVEILSRLQREPLLDLSISRTTFDWGIAVPGDAKHVMYAPSALIFVNLSHST